MIVFQKDNLKIDLTSKGITFKEVNDIFKDTIIKKYSFPFFIYANEENAAALGLVNIENVTINDNRIYGTLIKDNIFFDAYLSIDEVIDDKIELTLFYGDETRPFLDKNLRDFQYEYIYSGNNFQAHANAIINSSFPNVTHQFAKIYNDKIKELDNYQYFEGYVNNYDSGNSVFLENTIDVIDGQNVSVNRNVIQPMIYLLEILRNCMAQEGYEITGSFYNDDFIRKIILVPDKFLEIYANSQLQQYQFNYFTEQASYFGDVLDVFKKIHVPTSVGDYELKINLNLPDYIAQLFSIRVYRGFETLFYAETNNNNVNISETITIPVDQNTVLIDIIVELKLRSQNNSIQDYNSFEFKFKGSQLNIFPNYYSLRDFVPNITLREWLNILKNWFNLSIKWGENILEINYLNDLIENINTIDHSYYQDPNKVIDYNSYKKFKLNYINKEGITISKNGLIYENSNDNRAVNLEINSSYLKTSYNNNIFTGVYNNEQTNVICTLYDGLQNNEPLTVNSINGNSLDIISIYSKFWKKWLNFRTNSNLYKDKFIIHYLNIFSFNEALYKYNKKHLIRSIQKKRIDKEHYQVDLETETF